MLNHTTSVIALSIVVSSFYFLDIVFSKKGNWFFVRSLGFLFTTTFIGSIIKDEWEIFAIILPIVLFVCFVCALIYHSMYMASRKGKISGSDIFDFLHFIQVGYPEFRRELREAIDAEKKELERAQRNHARLNKEVRDRLPEFISKIYFLAQKRDLPAMQYCYVVMERFVNEFLSKNDARFTLREFDPATNAMVSIACTDEKSVPAPIPIRKKNMITQSMKENIPLLYSRNKQWHRKGNGSIESGKYLNYVSYCLLKSNKNIPYLSICLDVKDESSSSRLEALYDSNILAIIFKAMETRLQTESFSTASERMAA